MFGRNKIENDEPTPAVEAKEGGKGRPTPTRKEAESAARERAKTTVDPKATARQQRSANAAKMREAMRTGDDRYLPDRDKGPHKRFVRDWLDARITIIEWVIPAMLLTLVLGSGSSTKAKVLATDFEILVVLIVVIESLYLSLRMRKAFARKFPDDDVRGMNYYMLMRAYLPRPLRMPKVLVKIGGAPKVRK